MSVTRLSVKNGNLSVRRRGPTDIICPIGKLLSGLTFGAPCKALSISDLTIFRVAEITTLKSAKVLSYSDLRVTLKGLICVCGGVLCVENVLWRYENIFMRKKWCEFRCLILIPPPEKSTFPKI